MKTESKEQEAFLMASITSVLASHQWFMINKLDNSEYLPPLKLLITGLKDTASHCLNPEFAEKLEKHLENSARDLFVKYWLELAKEDDDRESDDEEARQATEAFNEGLGSVQVEYDDEDEDRPEDAPLRLL